MYDMNTWIENILKDKKRIAVPIMTHPGIELTGRTVYEAVTNGMVHYDAINALNSRFPAAACTIIMDLTVEAEAFGASIEYSENEIPTVIGRLVTNAESIELLEIPDLTKGRIPQYLLANRLAAENIKDKPIFGGMIGPFSLAGRLYDMSEFMMACYCEPETAILLLLKCTAFLTEYCLALKKQGIQGVIIAEPAAGLLSNEGCSEFSSRYIKEIVNAVQDEDFMVILHNCGNTGHCTVAMTETGAKGYHFGNKVDMLQVLKECPEDAIVMGNLDPVTLFQGGTPEDVEKATLLLLQKTAGYPNFVISTGCDIPPHVPHCNIEAFYRALDEYNKLR